MNNESFFNYGDIVRLKKDLDNTKLRHGDYAIVWAVYPYYAGESNGIALEFDSAEVKKKKRSKLTALFYCY